MDQLCCAICSCFISIVVLFAMYGCFCILNNIGINLCVAYLCLSLVCVYICVHTHTLEKISGLCSFCWWFFRFYLFERETETSSHPLLHSPNGLCLSARPCVSFFKIYLKVELHTGDGRGRSIALPWLVHSQNAATGKAGPLHSYELHSGVSHGWQGPKHL